MSYYDDTYEVLLQNEDVRSDDDGVFYVF